MVEQVDRELLFILANVPKEQAVGLYEGNFDHDPMVKRKLDAVKAFRIAAEARGMEKAAKAISDNPAAVRAIFDAARAALNGGQHE